MWHLIAWLHWWDGAGAPVVPDETPRRFAPQLGAPVQFRPTLTTLVTIP